MKHITYFSLLKIKKKLVFFYQNRIILLLILEHFRAALKIVAARLAVRGAFKIVAASIEAKS